MKILVTGASGFLGSHIVDACLAQGYQVRVIVRPSSDLEYLQSLGDQIEILTGDFTRQSFLSQALESIDGVVHSAARVAEVGHHKLFMESNVILTERLLEVSRQQGVKRFVFISSPSVVAELKDQKNIDERYPYPNSFLNEYCKTKAIAEKLVISANQEGFSTCALRPRAVWGPRDVSGPFAKFMKKMAQGKLPNLSGGKQIEMSICYVRNAANACVKALTADAAAGNVYFITDKETVELWTLMDKLAAYFSIPGVKKQAPLALVGFVVSIIHLLWKIPYLKNNVQPPLSRYSLGLITHSATYKIERAQKDLDYHAEISFDEAIAEYKAWIERNGGVEKYLAKVV